MKIIRIAAAAAAGIGLTTLLSGCVVAPPADGYGYGYGYSAPVVAPTVGISYSRGYYGGRGYYGRGRYWR